MDRYASYVVEALICCLYNSDFYFFAFLIEHKRGDELRGHSLISKYERSKYTMEDRLRYYKIPSKRSAEQVLEEARLSKSKFKPGTYKLRSQNCEHFAVFCKTGKSRSIQVEKSPLGIIRKIRKWVTPFRAKGVRQDSENGSQNLFPEEAGSSERVLSSSPNVKRRKTSDSHE